MDRQTIMDTMKARGFTYNLEIRDGNGNPTSYHFLSPISEDKAVFNCTVYPQSGDFKFTYGVPKSINTLESPKCGPFTNDAHFGRIKRKFEQAAQVLHQAFESTDN